MAATQESRLLKISTPLGDDFMLMERLSIDEGLSQLFVARAELLHDEGEEGTNPTVVDPRELLGKRVTIEIAQSDGSGRFLNGMVNRLSQGTRNGRFSLYEIDVVPDVWMLTRSVQSRIFQHRSVPDIIADVLAGFDFKNELQGDFKPRNFCVQYAETDWDFVSRLMEEEGIFYFFEHTENGHRMILANVPGSHRECPRQASIPYYQSTDDNEFAASILTWSVHNSLMTGKVTFWDYNFELPTNKLDAELNSRFDVGGNREIERYEFPGGYARKYDGVDRGGSDRQGDLQNIFEDKRRHAEIAMQQLDSMYELIDGSTDSPSITAGHIFKLTGHPASSQNGQYIVMSAAHSAEQVPSYYSEITGAGYSCSFRALAHGSGKPPFRPERRTPKPRIYGTQTATVVGPAGEEIFVDKYGRIKVQFHWDRALRFDPDSSCWVRVARDISGSKWGSMFIPRVGQEVIVDFEHGDPDKPIIVGSVYNAQTMPHYELPKYKTLTYIKTRTSPDDGKGYNELRFEDKAGKEQVFVRSQKRYDLRVRGSMYETCGGSRHEVIGLKQENQPGGNLAVTVAGCYDLHVKEAHYVGIDQKLNETVKGDVVENYQGKQYTEVTGKRELNAQEITLEALNKISLKVGGTFISIDLSGVTISGPMVKINSGGAAMGTGPSDIADPIDAEVSDNGKPGNLENRRSGGGGGRRSRTLRGQHAPPFQTTTLADGSIRVGDGIVIRPSATDPNFQQKALDDLTTMSNYPAGMDTLNSLNNSGQVTTIQHQPTGGNSYMPDNVADALPAGDTFNGTTGTGNGTGGTVNWNPDNPTTNAVRPRDVGLHHELAHSDHAAHGDYDITHADPSQPNNPHQEETNTIDRDNEYRRQRGVHTRTDHTTL